MKRLLLFIAILSVAGVGTILLSRHSDTSVTKPTKKQSTDSISEINKETAVIAENLDTPWGMAFLPDRSIVVTERPGRVRKIEANGSLVSTPIATLKNVKEVGEGGLLGIAVHPDFSDNSFVYIYYTYSSSNDNTP